MSYNRRTATNTRNKMTELESKLAVARAELEAIEAQIAEGKSAARAGNIATVRALMAEHGLTAADLGHSRALKAVKAKAAPMYRNDAGQTWAGRGKRPDWLRMALANGMELGQFRAAA